MRVSPRTRRWLGGTVAVGAAATVTALVLPSAFADGDLTWTLTEVPGENGPVELYGVDATAEDDVWSVGMRYGTGEAIVAHWDGERWTDTEHPGAGYYTAVDAVATDDVWAVGENQDGRATTAHYDGREWKQVDTPDLGTDFSQMTDVDAMADGTVWSGVLTSNEPEATAGPETARARQVRHKAADWQQTGILQHYDGSGWTVAKAPVPADAEWVKVDQVHGVSADEAWVAGYAFVPEPGGDTAISRPWAARYVDGDWTTVPIPGVEDLTRGFVSGIVADEAGNVSLAGNTFEGEAAVPMLLTWDGAQLSRQDLPEHDVTVQAVTPDGRGGVLLTGGTGTDGTTPVMLRITDGKPVVVNPPPTERYSYLMRSVVVPDSARVWTVGMNVDDGGMPTTPIAAHTELS